MPFENIDCVNPPTSTSTTPADGVSISARKLHLKKADRTVRFIKVTIGEDLARKITLTSERHKLAVGFGSGPDTGKVMISVDDQDGQFATKRQATGRYAFTINQASAEGLFATEFPAFERAALEALRPANGSPPHFVFKASEQMLAVDD